MDYRYIEKDDQSECDCRRSHPIRGDYRGNKPIRAVVTDARPEKVIGVGCIGGVSTGWIKALLAQGALTRDG